MKPIKKYILILTFVSISNLFYASNIKSTFNRTLELSVKKENYSKGIISNKNIKKEKLLGLLNTQPSLLTVNGKFLKDDCGETIILKGINHGNIYDVWDFGVNESVQIANTGANAMRIVVERDYCTFSLPNFNCVKVPTTPTHLTNMIQASVNNKLIPIVELHDFTGSLNPTADLITAANWWVQPSILEVLLSNQNYLILNIANEPSSSNYPPTNVEQTTYLNANISAINILRNAGLTCPIMIDGMHWGKDHIFFVNHGQTLQNADPLHKLIFSVHAYWPSTGNAIQVSNTQMTNYMNALSNVNAPIVIGELAHDEVQNSGIFPINYNLLLNLCEQHSFGYLIWWWGRIEPGTTSALYITTNGLSSGLTVKGNIIVNSHTNSVSTAIRPYKFVNGNCNPLGIDEYNDDQQILVYPNPMNDYFIIDTDLNITKIELYNSVGQKVSTSIEKTIYTTQLNQGLYWVRVFTNKESYTIKLIKQ